MFTPHSEQGHWRIERGEAEQQLCCWKVGGGNGEGGKEGREGGRGRSGDKKTKYGRRGGVGGAYTLLTTTSSHVPSFLGTYYSEAL